MQREEEIQLIAYQIWEEEHRPHGRGLDHWLKAEAIWEEQCSQQSRSKQSKPSAKRIVDEKNQAETQPRAQRRKQKKAPLKS